MVNKTDTALLGTEKVSTLLMRYAIPSIIAMTAASLYNIADSIFIGHGVDPLAFTGLAITLPLMNLSAAFGAMVGIGASSLMSIKLGQDDRKSAKAILGNTVLMNTVIGLAFGALCFVFLDRILYRFGSSDQTIGYARDYMQIILAGNVFTHLYLGLNNTLRATGYPRRSMAIMLFAIILNCGLDALFIFGLGWGIKGAAWATVIAQFLAMVIEFIHFSHKRHEIHFERSIFRFRKKIISGILSIGMAPLLMNISASVVVIFINNALQDNGGDYYVGAYGIVNRVALIFLMVVFGLNQGMQPIVGYNYGAKKFDRVKKALTMVIVAATCITTVSYLFCLLFPDLVTKVFTKDQELMAIARTAIRVVLIMFPLVGYQVVVTSFFQSIGHAKTAIFLSLTRQLIFLFPLLIILPRYYGATGVWVSIPIADFVSIILAAVMMTRLFRQFRKQNINI
ncbi:MAG: MATE family efflux transporter [Rikenellaceae bacterium]|nr:MATE family efflux transporter [Rikenellaceae bacterium]